MKYQLSQLVLFTAVSAAALVTPMIVLAQQTPQYPMPHQWYGWHGWFFGPIMMIAFFALAFVAVVTLVRWLGGQSHGLPPHISMSKTPLDILKERYARGEIEKDEFEERRRLLGD